MSSVLVGWMVSRSSWTSNSMNLARARWRFLRKASGVDLGAGDFAELHGDLLDRRLGEVAPELQHGGVAVLGCRRLVGLQPGPDSVDHGLPPDAVEILVRPGGIEQVAGGKRLQLRVRKWSMMSRWSTVRR